MRDRKIVICMFILAFLLSVAIVGTGKTSPALTFGCDPDLIIDIGVPGTWLLRLTAFDATDLFLTEYYLSWDPAILNTTVGDITTGDTVPYLEFMMIKEVNAAEGWLHIVVGRPIGTKVGLTGDVQTAKIIFTVLAEGSSGLHLYDVRLKNSVGVDMTIEKIIDGFFASSGYSHYAFACDSIGALQNVFAVGEMIYVVGGGFSAERSVDIWLVPNATWTDGDPLGIPVLPVVTVGTVKSPTGPHLKFGLPITALGKPPNDSYDVVVDFDQDGVYDAATDGVDDVMQWPGFTGGRALRGDINQDDTVGSADFSILAGNYGKSFGDPAYDENADIDSNGNVGSSDFSILAGEYGQSA